MPCHAMHSVVQYSEVWCGDLPRARREFPWAAMTTRFPDFTIGAMLVWKYGSTLSNVIYKTAML